jgi:hypothetical protein
LINNAGEQPKSRAQKKIPAWRQKQIENFITVLGLAVTDLERAYREKRITTLAWVTRNLLEISVWIDYCNLSDTHAQRFRDDAIQDLHGLSKAVAQSIEINTGQRATTLMTKLAELETFAQSKGIRRLADDFTPVSSAADELGRKAAFTKAFKALSKFAHPTAWSIQTVTSVETDEGYRLTFLEDGVELAINSLIAIRNAVRTIYPEVAR